MVSDRPVAGASRRAWIVYASELEATISEFDMYASELEAKLAAVEAVVGVAKEIRGPGILYQHLCNKLNAALEKNDE